MKKLREQLKSKVADSTKNIIATATDKLDKEIREKRENILVDAVKTVENWEMQIKAYQARIDELSELVDKYSSSTNDEDWEKISEKLEYRWQINGGSGIQMYTGTTGSCWSTTSTVASL